MNARPHDSGAARSRGGALEVFLAFLRLGLTSFGGPIAHLGYFRDEFVVRRAWLGERAYAELVALCQFLPGPASSQVGFALGLGRAGWKGALAAWLGFTLPSALLLALFARGLAWAGGGSRMLDSVVHGLKIVAVVVVAQAVWSMWKALCPDRRRRALALSAALLALAWPGATAQLLALGMCALVGWRFLATPNAPESSSAARLGPDARAGAIALALFAALLLGLPLAASVSEAHWVRVVEAFYRAGALVFGGGHVVLPLLQAGVVEPGWVSESAFLAGYGAAQAVPGPLFAFAAYLGSLIGASAGSIAGAGGGLPIGEVAQSLPAARAWLGAAACLAAIFLPGCLILVAALPYWNRLRERAGARAAIAGVNAGVVGLLLATSIDPVATGAIRGPVDAAVAALLVLALRARWAPLSLVAAGTTVGALRAFVAS
ncbi:MAG: chromate efflux transporter [Burkholderiaceae bacterium]|nr:chromate efflux transporter [Burkholderiaceae bacterium]